jgi:predicted ribosome quality control (RQC) complex YloA/Tae2 family protein
MAIDILVTTFQTNYSAELNFPEDGSWELLRSVGTRRRIYTASYSRRIKSFINGGDVV